MSRVDRVPLWHHPCPRGRRPGQQISGGLLSHSGRDNAEHNSDWVKATTKFNAAHEILDQIKTQNPEWNPHIIEFRIKYVEDIWRPLHPKVGTLERKIPASKPKAPAIGPSSIAFSGPTKAVRLGPSECSVGTPLSSTTNAKTFCICAGPQGYHHPCGSHASGVTDQAVDRGKQVQQLQVAREGLNAKLQEQLGKVAPTQTNQQSKTFSRPIRCWRPNWRRRRRRPPRPAIRSAVRFPPQAPTPAPTPAPGRIARAGAVAHGTLPDPRRIATDEGRTPADARRVGHDQGIAGKIEQADDAELRPSYDAVIAQLTDANKRLTSAKASGDKDDEIIRQLRKENALLRIIAERKASASFVGGESGESTNGPSIPELRGWRPHQRPTAQAKEQSQPETATPASAMEESGRGKLVATLTSPKKAETPRHRRLFHPRIRRRTRHPSPW